MIVLKDSIAKEMIQFLEHCESKGTRMFVTLKNIFHSPDYGHNIPTAVEQPLQQNSIHSGRNTVTYEARLLKALYLRVL